MSEILNECNVHPVEDNSFKSSVLKCLIARQILAPYLPPSQNIRREVSTEFITALGVDEVWSALVNDCAGRIASGTCNRYTVQSNGLSVQVEPRTMP